MRIIPGERPDFWFDFEDLTSGSLIIIRRESVTSCGFLGGDSLLIVTSGSELAHLLKEYRSVLPRQERIERLSEKLQNLEKRKNNALSSLRALDEPGEPEPGLNIPAWEDTLTRINETIWFAGNVDLFRFSLEPAGDINTFLEGSVYHSRLITSLHWWYHYEAAPDEQERFIIIPLIENLRYPEHRDLIVRAINLYNHGAYELARP